MHDMLDSKSGSWLVVVYVVVSMVLAGYSFICTWDSCSALIVAPVMPWAYLLDAELGMRLSIVMYPVLILLNASVAYTTGVIIEWFRRS
jgi:hypothetical protein